MYVNDGCFLDEGEIDDLKNAFSGEIEGCEEDVEAHAKSLRDFLIEYLGDDDYYITQDCIIINFFTDFGKPVRNDKRICEFIYNLNAVLHNEMFASYTIF